MGNSGQIKNILIPNVTKTGKSSQKKIQDLQKNDEFQKEFLASLEKASKGKAQQEVHFSKHAKKRIEERNLSLDGEEFFKLRGAIDKLKNKGGKDSLVITNNAAYIVDVDNETVVTAMAKDDMKENVFTKIDSTLFIN